MMLLLQEKEPQEVVAVEQQINTDDSERRQE
jgi:hypothetical protein